MKVHNLSHLIIEEDKKGFHKTDSSNVILKQYYETVFIISKQGMDCCIVGYGCLILHQITLQMSSSGHTREYKFTLAYLFTSH